MRTRETVSSGQADREVPVTIGVILRREDLHLWCTVVCVVYSSMFLDASRPRDGKNQGI